MGSQCNQWANAHRSPVLLDCLNMKGTPPMKTAIVTITIWFAAWTAAHGAEERALPEGITCVVCGKPASAEYAADWKGGKVYLACPNCVAAFLADSKNYAVTANAQLVATGQAKQVACPITGREVQPGRTVDVDGIEVSFCCVGCQGRVAKAKGDVRRYLVFSENAFAKGFKVASKRGQ